MPKPMVDIACEQANWFERWLLQLKPWSWVKNYLIIPLANRLLPALGPSNSAFEQYVRDETKCAASFETAQTEVCYDVIKRETFEQIHQECKRRGVTINSACQAAGDIVLCEMITESARAKGVTDVKSMGNEMVFVAPSHKRRSAMPSAERDNYVINSMSLIMDQIQISEWNHCDSFWLRANKVQTLVHSSLSSSVKLTCFISKLLSYCLLDITNYCRYHSVEKRICTHGYTNHGNCNYLNRDGADIKISGVVTGTSKIYCAGAFYNFITTLDNKLIWNCCYPNNYTDRDTMKRYLRRVIEIMSASCGIE